MIASRINSAIRWIDLITQVTSDKWIGEKITAISYYNAVSDLSCFINLAKQGEIIADCFNIAYKFARHPSTFKSLVQFN